MPASLFAHLAFCLAAYLPLVTPSTPYPFTILIDVPDMKEGGEEQKGEDIKEEDHVQGDEEEER